jgi:hypothetical protein
MKPLRAALAACVLLLLVQACTQATGGTPSIRTSGAASTLADAAFQECNAAVALVYQTVGAATPATGVSVTGGTSTAVSTTYTFNEPVTLTDYDSVDEGIFATGDVTMKGKRDTSGTGSWTYSGDLFMSGTNDNGHVVLTLSVSSNGTVTKASGTVTVKGTEYKYTGSE